MSGSVTDMKQVSSILHGAGSSANVVNLVLLLVIGWNARDVLEDTLSTVESTEVTVTDLKADNVKLREEFTQLRQDVMANQQLRDEFSRYRADNDAQMAKLIICLKSRKKCAL